MTSGTPRTTDEIRLALNENRAEPEGAARNARAESLVREAEAAGDRKLLVEALFALLTAYNYSSEKDKKFVPFARALAMWDEDPSDFDDYATYQLHWYFKWVSAGMLDQPHIPLAAIEKWQTEMAYRYRLAGHSERAVRQGELRIARHVGDRARAEAAYAAWQAADRDRMSDCHACELHLKGSWEAERGQDAQALESWSRVLGGELTCVHEPHAALASSLLPLLRLGRLDEARAHHLRGYRMVRTKESMRAAVAEHIEFCALTGNEARALEILAQHPAYFTTTGDPDSLTDYMAVTALLTGRLCALGHGERRLPGPDGTLWTAAALHEHARDRALDLAARFDARNGTDAVSTAVRARMSRPPLHERLPLGVRTPARLGTTDTATPRPAAPATPAGDGAAPAPDLAALVAEAYRLTAAGTPAADAAWAAVDTAARATGTPLDAAARAHVAEHAAMAASDEDGHARAIELFTEAAALYEEAGDPGGAAAGLARRALAHARAGDPERALAQADEQCAALRALHAEGRATVQQTSGGLLIRARVLLTAADDREPGPDALTAAAEQAAEVVVLCEGHAGEPVLAGRLAQALTLLGKLAASRGDHDGARRRLTRAIQLHEDAGSPWGAAEPESVLTELAMAHGDFAAAAQHGAAALDHAGESLPPAARAGLHLLVAQARANLGDHEAAAGHALEATQWADEAGDGGSTGAAAGLVLGGALLRTDRHEEAAAVLESALPDLEREADEGMVVQARWWLGDCHTGLGEPRAAAEQYLRAARIAQHWEEPRDHAMLAHLAADALSDAGRVGEAVAAYERAERLWRTVGDPQSVVRTLRARGWLELRKDRGGLAAARPLMDAAVEAAAGALAAAEAGDGDAATAALLRRELADSYRQTAEILVRSRPGPPADDPASTAVFEEALGLADRAVAVLDPLGAAGRDQRTGLAIWAARLELRLSRPAPAATRARAVTTEYGDTPGPLPDHRRTEALAILEAAQAL